MMLFIPSIAMFILCISSPPDLRRGFAIMCLVSALGGVPILIWNAQHDWVTVRHVGWQAGAREGWHWFGPLTFVAGQFGMLLGFWFVAWAVGVWRSRPWVETSSDRRFLWCMSLPTFAIFMLVSLKTTGQLNWAVTAYLSGGVLAAAWLATTVHRAWRIATLAAVALGLVVTVVVHYPALSRPVLLSIVGTPTAQHPLPLRRVDPTARLRGYRTLAAAVDRLRDELRAGGEEPIVAATFWNIPGLLGVYCDGHPTEIGRASCRE